MAELREVFEMVTKQTEPDVDAWREQEQRQRRTSRTRKFGALALAAVIGIAAVVVVIRAGDDGTGTQAGDQPTGTKAEPIGSITDGPLEPGRYVIATHDAAFNASHRVTIDVPDGYEGVGFVGEFQVLKAPLSVSGSDTGVGVYVVGYAFADACDWNEPSPVSSADELVASLAGQQGLRPSPPTDVVVGGFAATYMELTVPAQAKLDRCTNGRMQAWALTGDGSTWIWLNNADQHDLLWILDVDGVPLVIDAFLAAGASAQERAELEQIVESIQIDRT
jgi:hypothetical protein